MALIGCNEAAFAYDGRRVVWGLNFAVEQGDYLCIVGENGAGKSTLIKGLLGLMKPCEGQVYTGEGLIHGQIGYLPQQTQVRRGFPASVWEVALSGCLGAMGRRPFFGRAERRRAEESLERLGIAELKGRCYCELSGGQQRRALLARALCAAERLLLLDEPAAGLDPVATAEMYGLISRLNREGMAVIMVSHDMVAAVHNAAHILHLNPRGHFYGTGDQYRQSRLGKAFLGGKGHA